MLYHLLYEFLDINIFKYITFRAFYALVTSFALALIFGPCLIRRLRVIQRKEGGYVRAYTDHTQKKYVPTMGGILIIVPLLISSVLWCRLDNIYIWITLFVLVSFAVVGGWDDYNKLVRKKGISSRIKFLLQLLFATIASSILYIYPKFDSILYFPFFKNLQIDLGFLYLFFMIFIIVATSNAVNLTDGLDGLAIGPAMISAAAFAFFAYLAGNSVLANYLKIAYIQGSGELTVFLMALLGAGLGFLWFNSFPAEIFMGDAGALSIGAVLGTVAIITKQEIALAIVGGIFVVETLSVILQVAYFKFTGGKRIFLMAPLHHHFEKLGIPEPKIVVRVWIISILLAIIALSTLKIR